jgi:agmatinase
MVVGGKDIPFAGCFTEKPGGDGSEPIVFAGLPDDSQSSFRRGCAEAPARIRSAYDGNCYSATTESGVDLTGAVADLGDWASEASRELTAKSYRESATQLFRAGRAPFFAGGDHAVTVPIVEALAALGEPVHVIQFDAHPDLYPEYEGSRTSHACVAARLLEMEHVASVTQLGIRTLNAPQAKEAERCRERVHLYYARDLTGELPWLDHIPAGAPVYITVDLDGFDPAFAPGVAHAVPGGLRPRQVLNFLQGFHWRLVGMDAVEVSPGRDVNDQTAVLAARLLHEGMGCAARRR